MGRIRFSMTALMGLVALAATGLAAVSHPTVLWASAAFSLALAMNFGATVAAIGPNGPARPLGIGFAVCGWGYLIVSLGPWFDPNVSIYLITTYLIEQGYQRRVPDPYSFHRIVHSLFGIASGLAGGLFSRSLAPRPVEPDRPTISNTGHP